MRGFSLVELSIVLVILGLLTGGILAGQSLIRAAELRAVSTEYNRYVTAGQTFRDKYFAVPGDFREATKFWNLQVVGSNCVSNHGLSTTGTPGACDGNGNGTVTYSSGVANEANEAFQFWRHLAHAGLIEGTYSGIAGPTVNYHSVITGSNANIPVSRISGAGYMIFTYTAGAGHPQWFEGPYSNVFFFGTQATNSYTSGRVLTSTEAWNLDTKMDDGKPARGSVRAWVPARDPNCTDGPTLEANYLLTSSGIACTMTFDTKL